MSKSSGAMERSSAMNAGGGKSIAEKTLPQLTGTEKQVNWAETIRQNYIAAMESLISETEQSLSQKITEENTQNISKDAAHFAVWAKRFAIDMYDENEGDNALRDMEYNGLKDLARAARTERGKKPQIQHYEIAKKKALETVKRAKSALSDFVMSSSSASEWIDKFKDFSDMKSVWRFPEHIHK